MLLMRCTGKETNQPLLKPVCTHEHSFDSVICYVNMFKLRYIYGSGDVLLRLGVYALLYYIHVANRGMRSS